MRVSRTLFRWKLLSVPVAVCVLLLRICLRFYYGSLPDIELCLRGMLGFGELFSFLDLLGKMEVATRQNGWEGL